MAADLVENPYICHTFVHDLESLFWVLMWMIATWVNTSWDINSCSNFINDTITLKLYTTSGGRVKKLWLTLGELLKELKIPNNPPLKELVMELGQAVTL
jgi:Fungal protein kinase